MATKTNLEKPVVRETEPRPKLSLVQLYFLVAFAAALAVASNAILDLTVTVRGDDFILFAVIYIVAQATERLVEPLMGWSAVAPQTETLKKKVGEEKTKLAAASAAAASGSGPDNSAAPEAQETLSKAQKERAQRGWALASVFALIICGLLGLGLIESVSTVKPESGWKYAVFSAVDIVVTGLAVGAGTKPLHDLITRIEKSKEKADPATDSAVPAAR